MFPLKLCIRGCLRPNHVLATLLVAFIFCSVSIMPVHSQSTNSGYVLVRVNCFEIRALPADLPDGDVAELQLMVIVSDGEQVNGAFTFFQDSPSAEVRPVRAGERYCGDTDANGPWFAVDGARDQVAVWFVALDSDDLDLIESAAADAASIAPVELLARGLKELIGDTGVLSLLSRSNLVSAVLDFAFSRALEVWELPDTIGEYQTVLWRQQGWNLGLYTAVSPDGNIVIEYEVLLTERIPPPVTSGTLQPTATSISPLICLSFDDLSTLGNVLQALESPPGVLAGAQIAFAQSWSAPSGWIIHRNSQQVQSVSAGDIASVWSPDACRPLQRQSVSFIETYCYGECWEYDVNARTMRWTGYTDGREDVWQPQGTPLERVRAGYTVIFGPMLVPGEIFACRLVIDGEVRKNACDGVNVFVPAGAELRVISDGNVGGFRWCPREGYGYRADQSYQCR